MLGHWASRARKKRRDQEVVACYAVLGEVPKARSRRRVDLTITLEKGARRPDPDAWWKSTLDSLVRAGLLVDDGPKWCEIGRVDYVRADEPATTITLTDLKGEGEK